MARSGGLPVPTGIKSIQRGSIAITGTSATATISSVNVAKTTLNMLGFTSGDSISNPGQATAGLEPSISLSNGTTITAQRSRSATFTTTVSWEAVEWN